MSKHKVIRAEIIVKSYENNSMETFNKAINRFKRKVAKAGILRLVKKRKFYIKPSEIKHKKVQESKRKRSR